MGKPPTAGAALVRQMFSLIDARDWEALAHLFHPEMTYERPGYAPLHGRDAVLHFYREVRIIGSGIHRLESILEDRDLVMSSGHFTGVTRSGEAVAIGFAERYCVREGQVVARRTYFFVPAV